MGKAERKIIVADSLPTGLSITCSVRSCQRDISVSISIAKTEGTMDMLSYICRYNYVSGASIARSYLPETSRLSLVSTLLQQRTSLWAD
jgi:hypothetical protein